MLYIAVVEKNTLVADQIQKHVQNHLKHINIRFLVYDTYEKVDSISKINILFSSIEQIKDIDSVREIQEKNPAIQIIFYSDCIEWALEIYDIPHVYFILKDELPFQIEKAIQRSLSHLKALGC